MNFVYIPSYIPQSITATCFQEAKQGYYVLFSSWLVGELEGLLVLINFNGYFNVWNHCLSNGKKETLFVKEKSSERVSLYNLWYFWEEKDYLSLVLSCGQPENFCGRFGPIRIVVIAKRSVINNMPWILTYMTWQALAKRNCTHFSYLHSSKDTGKQRRVPKKLRKSRGCIKMRNSVCVNWAMQSEGYCTFKAHYPS